jgi:hypothetical protein
MLSIHTQPYILLKLQFRTQGLYTKPKTFPSTFNPINMNIAQSVCAYLRKNVLLHNKLRIVHLVLSHMLLV